MTWLDYQRTLKELLLAENAARADFAPFGGDASRWQAYRRMVRSRFYQTIDHAFERLIGVVGTEVFHRLVDRYLADRPPQSPYLRDLPGEFLRYVERHHAELSGSHALPPYALDLMRFEWAELDTAYSGEEDRAVHVIALDMDGIAVLSPAHRLLELDYRVHEMGVLGEGAPPARSPVSLCLYRDSKTHEVETLVLTPVAARILIAISQKTAPLAEIVRCAALAAQLPVDVPFVEALSTLLADLTERGLLLGSLPQLEEY